METQSDLLEAAKQYVQENSLSCSLYISAGTHLSRMAVTDDQKTIRLSQEMPTEDFFKGKVDLLNLRFLKSFLIVSPKNLSLVPQGLYNEDFSIGEDLKSEAPYSSVIDKQNCVANFEVSERQRPWLSLLKGSELIPTSKLMINFLTDLKVKYKTVLGLNFYKKHFEVVYLEDSNLKFYGQFPSTTADEFNFFLLTLFEKLELNPALVQFYLWGYIKKADENFNRLAKYSRNLNLLDSNFLLEAIACE